MICPQKHPAATYMSGIVEGVGVFGWLVVVFFFIRSVG